MQDTLAEGLGIKTASTWCLRSAGVQDEIQSDAVYPRLSL